MRIVGLLAAFGLLAAGCGDPVSAPQVSGSTSDAPAPSTAEPFEAGWTELPDAPITPRHAATAVWANDTLLVFGGRDTAPCPPGADCRLPEQPPLRDGARFDPTDQTWTTIADLPVALGYATATVVADEVYIWSPGVGFDAETSLFLSYDPASDRWSELPPPPAAAGQWVDLEAGDGEVFFVQGSHENGWRPDLRYDITTQTYAPLPEDPLAPSYDRDLTYVGGMLVLTGIDVTASPGGADGPAVYRAATWTDDGDWRELPSGSVAGFSPDWFAVDGTLVNPTPGGTDGGEVNPYNRVHPLGGVLDPRTGTWTDLPTAPDQASNPGLELGRALGDPHLLISSSGLALQPDRQRWIRPGVPNGAPEQGSAAVVGEGRLWIVGGAHWDAPTDATLLDAAWVWTPPQSGS
ncbi:MAG: hypothetical protein KG028_04795 [Actinobacteria bacterium]|nr:hypothetical protein [Actinomycetota bacterium]